jgi:hypothetical protein
MKLSLISASLVAAMALSVNAHAVTVNFDEISLPSSGIGTVTNQYSGQGITFGSGFGVLNLLSGTVTIPSSPNYAYLNATTETTLTFNGVTNSFGFTTLGLNANSGFFSGMTVTGKSSTGATLFTQTFNPSAAGAAVTGSPQVWNVPGIASVVFQRIDGANGPAIAGFDNLTFNTPTAVPVPAAVWLFGSGLATLFATRRNRKA